MPAQPTPHQPTASAAAPAPPARRDPLVWFSLFLGVTAVVGGLVYLGYRHPPMVAPVGLGLASLAIVSQVATWLISHHRS
ncbi:hypothetical protein OG749_46070 (plasmid) [Streptomyces nojiriensis]|uniref:hypothetical protein n=1 Tax=Streptomyces nojiriensis TaxID=66374 RepID=UPI002E17A62E